MGKHARATYLRYDLRYQWQHGEVHTQLRRMEHRGISKKHLGKDSYTFGAAEEARGRRGETKESQEEER